MWFIGVCVVVVVAVGRGVFHLSPFSPCGRGFGGCGGFHLSPSPRCVCVLVCAKYSRTDLVNPQGHTTSNKYDNAAVACNNIAGATGLIIYLQSQSVGGSHHGKKDSVLETRMEVDNGADAECEGGILDLPEYPGLPIAESSLDIYQDSGSHKALLAADWRKVGPTAMCVYACMCMYV